MPETNEHPGMSPLPDRHDAPDGNEGNFPSLASLLSLLESVPAMVWQTGPDLHLTRLGGAALRQIRITPAQFESRPIDDLFSSRMGNSEARRAHEAALQGEPASFEIDLNGRDLRA